MKILFSKRHIDAIRQKKLPLSFSKNLRTTVVRILEQYSDWGGWCDEENFTFDQAEEILKTFWGTEKIFAFDGNDRIPASFRQLILSGYPSEVIDAIEAWFVAKPKATDTCEKDLNDAFAMNRSPWRFVNGEAILIDSEYLHTEVQAKTLRLLKSGRAFGALQEFQEAIQDLQSGETKDAIVKAHKSVESVMKVALETKEHFTFGRLLSDLIKSSIIPDYYEEFLKHFEKLALGAVKERNRPGRGHGQGPEITSVSRSLAEFAINLAGSVNLFIIQRWLEIRKKKDPRRTFNSGR
jgi:HEPN domain-containing protein